MSTVVVDRREWDQLMQDTERLVKNYERLLGKVKDLEEEKRLLEERLAAGQVQLRELQKQVEIDPKEVLAIKELRSAITRLIKDSETIKIG